MSRQTDTDAAETTIGVSLTSSVSFLIGMSAQMFECHTPQLIPQICHSHSV